MSTIIDYIQRPAVFEPEAIAVMGDAYERALRIFPTSAPENVRQVIATRIIELARTGERDPHTLCEQSLAGIDGLVGPNAATSKAAI
ncbi:MAG: hypothetical protein WAJ88_05520 [Pseudolabrys sp.]